jgi:hypothetical protein
MLRLRRHRAQTGLVAGLGEAMSTALERVLAFSKQKAPGYMMIDVADAILIEAEIRAQVLIAKQAICMGLAETLVGDKAPKTVEEVRTGLLIVVGMLSKKGAL